MGRLTEYFGTGRSRTSYIGSRPGNADVVVTGADEVVAKLNHIITKDAAMERELRKIIRKALQQARSKISKDIHGAIGNDPRKAYKAVRHSVYKAVFGGSVNILAKRKAGVPGSYAKPRTLAVGQRGGNRIVQSERTKKLESYQGSDRGFVLRFLNAGTDTRRSKYGNRGSIAPRSVFARIAPWHMQQAVDDVSAGIIEIINKEMNR